MQAKRFIAADMRRALEMVKMEFGEDAMILSTERTAKGVELVATVEAPLAINDPVEQSLQEQPLPAAQQKIASAAARFHSQKPVPPQTAQPQYTPSITSNGGSISGKSRQQLADEMELASRKMMAARKAESMTLESLSQTESFQPSVSQPSVSQPVTSKPVTETESDYPVQEHNDEILRLQHEIADMRQHLQAQLSQMAHIQERQYQASQEKMSYNPVQDVQEVTPVAIEIRQHLDQLGLTKACNDQVMASLKLSKKSDTNKQLVWTEALALLSRSIPSDVSDITAQGGMYAFVGTTGVGKTTTIAKLAARYVMNHGGDNVILLTTDNYRIASHNQLKSLARILGIQVQVVESLEQLPALLSTLSKHKLVLIDTPGMSHSDPLLKSHLAVLQQCPQVKNLLVLSASSQYQMMKASLHCYRAAGLYGCVLTKLDECATLGDAMSMLSEHTLPLCYTTDGQSVPDDIATTKSSQLVSKAIAILKSRNEYQPKVRKSIS